MRKSLRTLFALFAVGLSSAAWAQTEQGWTSGAEVAAGDFYFYNTGTKQYLAPGYSSWGTEAWSMPHARKLTLTANGDGYNVDTHISNGGSNNYLVSTWMDGAATAWTFTKLEDGAYTIQNTTGYLAASNGASKVLTNASDSETNNEWLLITKEMITTAMNKLTYDGSTYVDATPFIACPDVVRNDQVLFRNSWTFTLGSCAVRPTDNGSNDNTANANGLVEFYNQNYDMNQTLTNMPNGTYIVRVQGFYRPGYNGTTNTNKNAILYANESESTMMLLSEGSATTCNNMAEASTAFIEGDFSSNSVKVVVTNGTLKIGLKKNSHIDGDWTIFDNFSLEYYGVDLTELKATLKARIDACAAYDNETMSTTAKNALSTAKTSGETTYNTSATESDINTAITDLNTALANAQASVEAYATLNAALTEYAEKAKKNLTTDGQTQYTSNVSAIQTAYTSGTYSDEVATAAVSTVAEAYTSLLKTEYVSGSDMTDLLVSPSFDGNNDAWTKNVSGSGTIHNVILENTAWEVWTTSPSTLSMDIYQTVTALPAGVYRVTAEMKNHKAQNNEGNGYVNGSTGLYAQTSSNFSFVGVATQSDDRTAYSVLITVKENESLQLGVKNAYTEKAQWFNVDNFTLTYVGSDYSTISDDEAAVTSMSAFTTVALKEVSDAKVKTATTAASAIETFNANKTMANYEAVQNAMKNVYPDIDLYYKSDKVTFNDWAVENGIYYLTYTPFTAVDLDQCYFTAYSVSVNGTKVTKTPLTGVVPASTPLLLTDTKASSTYCAMMSEAEGKTVTTDLKSSDGTITGDESTIYALGIGSTSNVLGWYLLKSGTTMTEGKCYLKVEASGVKFLGFSDDDATGINAVSNSTKNAARYNLSGQRVGNDYKGIVIENGKKYLVK